MMFEEGAEVTELEGEMFVQCFISYKHPWPCLDRNGDFINSQVEVRPGSSKVHD